MKRLDHFKKGFSLLELLVVIGIIAILLSVGIAGYNAVQRRSRDAKRSGDLKAIGQAMEQYYSVCGLKYPDIGGGGWDVMSPLYCADPTIAIMPTVPTDPKTASPYPCAQGALCTANQYTLCATPEIATEICVRSQQ